MNKHRRKSKSAKTIEYWTRQLKRIFFLLLCGVGIVVAIYVIVWLILRLFELLGK